MVTRLSAALAVVHVEFAALNPTSVADIGADAADFLYKLRSATHIRRRRPADFGAVFIEPNAVGHFLDVLLAKACVSAMLALLGTLNTDLDAFLVFQMAHRILPVKVNMTGTTYHGGCKNSAASTESRAPIR
jgi:hypothetical protein